MRKIRQVRKVEEGRNEMKGKKTKGKKTKGKETKG